jgi:regulation of enolase protein 1 (concanavalin A-like superfamily)
MTESRLRPSGICLLKVGFAFLLLILVPAAARAQLPAPWQNDDVGSVSIAGSATYASSGVYEVKASGANIWGTADGFHFVFRPLTGDGQITARVDSVTPTDDWAKAGVMMRDGLGPGNPHAFAHIAPAGYYRFMRRLTTGDTSAVVTQGSASAPYWVRLVRAGNVFRAYVSPNGSTWTAAGSTTIAMSSTIHVGLAVTSHTQSARTTARFSSVSVGSTSGNQLPTVALSSPASGATFSAPATINLAATASDPDGSISQVQFYAGSALLGTDTTGPYTLSASNMAAGSYALTAVATDNAGARRTSAAVNVTVQPGSSTWQDEDVGSVAAIGTASWSTNRLTIRGAGWDIWGSSDAFHFVYQTLAGDGEIIAHVDSLQVTDVWAKTGVMMRETLSASSAHAFALQSAQAGVAFQRRVVPGGTSTHTAGTTGSAPRWLRLVRRGALFTAFESADGTAWRTIGSQTISMQPTIYVGLAVTSHIAGTLTTAVLSGIKVAPTGTATNQPPTVSITSPTAGASFTAPASVSLAATAADSDGTVTQVQFFAGSTLLGTDTTSPFTFNWTNVAAGTYSLTAVARDNDGATRRSTAVSITVTTTVRTSSSGPPTRAVFNPSPDHAIVTYYLLEIFTAGSNPSTATPVASRNLGKGTIVNNEISIDIAAFIQALAPGSYIATVASVNLSGKSRSAPSATWVR